MKKAELDIYCVVPNFNGVADLPACIDSLLAQSLPCKVVVADNGSSDGSVDAIRAYAGQGVKLVKNRRNLGFAGGVNSGIGYALARGATHVALFNNDAVAEPKWLAELLAGFDCAPQAGIVTGKLLKMGEQKPAVIDSTGDVFSIWGLAFPRGREEPDNGQYDRPEYVFSASGGASLYRAEVFQRAGLFDEDFFAYYEDVDFSFRAQLAGYRVYYQPTAVAWHKIGATSRKMPGFTAYHSFKNTLLLPYKNLPLALLLRYAPRFWLIFLLLFVGQIRQGNGWPVIRGSLVALLLLPKKTVQRWRIQAARKVSSRYIDSLLYHDLPPDRHRLRRLRQRLKPRRGRQ